MIRRSKPTDKAAVMGLWNLGEQENANSPNLFRHADLTPLLEACDSGNVFVAVEDGVVIGMICTSPTQLGLAVGDLVIDARYRRRGIGMALIDETREECGGPLIAAAPPNSPLHRFFDLAGFQTSACLMELP
jgi:GNAT superfamily N-acetyltransferase